jgi:hypothetical protein
MFGLLEEPSPELRNCKYMLYTNKTKKTPECEKSQLCSRSLSACTHHSERIRGWYREEKQIPMWWPFYSKMFLNERKEGLRAGKTANAERWYLTVRNLAQYVIARFFIVFRYASDGRGKMMQIPRLVHISGRDNLGIGDKFQIAGFSTTKLSDHCQQETWSFINLCECASLRTRTRHLPEYDTATHQTKRYQRRRLVRRRIKAQSVYNQCRLADSQRHRGDAFKPNNWITWVHNLLCQTAVAVVIYLKLEPSSWSLSDVLSRDLTIHGLECWNLDCD